LLLNVVCAVDLAADLQSKATPLGAVVKFAAGGKQRGKKDLAMLAMETYGQDVYVASVCLEANYAQVMKAFAEAEAHKGVSLIVAYAPCVMQVRLLLLLSWVRALLTALSARSACFFVAAVMCTLSAL
jgi:pyruvate/2-oxoacid:ferredoxin oxidoreductase beta subunit